MVQNVCTGIENDLKSWAEDYIKQKTLKKTYSLQDYQQQHSKRDVFCRWTSNVYGKIMDMLTVLRVPQASVAGTSVVNGLQRCEWGVAWCPMTTEISTPSGYVLFNLTATDEWSGDVLSLCLSVSLSLSVTHIHTHIHSLTDDLDKALTL